MLASSFSGESGENRDERQQTYVCVCMCVFESIARLVSLRASRCSNTVWGWLAVPLPAAAPLTFLQLRHPEVVLEERLTAEGVCQQHLQEQPEKQQLR